MRSFAALVIGSAALFAFACGGRNLDPPELEATEAAGGAGPGAGAGGEGGATSTSAVGGMGGSGGEGGSPPEPPMPLECLACIGTECPQTLQCVTDPACGQGLFCAFTECLGGGGTPDLPCVAQCFDGDFGAAADAISAIVCINTTCGDACGDFLPF